MISAARGEMAVLDAFQRLGVPPHDVADRILGGETVVDDQLFDFARQARVFDEMHVRGKDGAVLAAEFFRHRVLVGARLVCRGLERGAQPGGLRAEEIGVHVALRNAKQFRIEDQGRADGHSGRNGNASLDFHGLPGRR